MSGFSLEQRVTKLEELVGELVTKSDTSPRRKDWRRTVGMFDGDPVMEEIIEAGRQIREEDRKKASPG